MRKYLSILPAIIALATVSAQADTIYRETFGNSTAARVTPNVYGWQAYDASGNFFDTTGSGFGVDVGNGTAPGAPTDVANVNAGLNSDGTSGAQAGSRIFWNGAHRFAWTPEYTVQTANYQVGSITFSFYLGNQNVSVLDEVRVAVHVGSDFSTGWFYSVAAFSAPNVASASFNTLALLKTLTYDPTAANWNILNFNGTYNGGGTPGGPTAVKAASSGALTSGGAAGADLSGDITAFGIIYLKQGGTFADNSVGNIRFDTFQIDATPVPEPTSLSLLALGSVAGMAIIRRRK